MNKNNTNTVWFIYDGQCPICQFGSNNFKIKEAVGHLETLDGRGQKDHPIVKEITQKGYDLDQGMVIKFDDNYYHGVDALHVMALIGGKVGMFNKINCFMFRSKFISNIFYPLFKFIRNFLLKIRGIKKINNLG